ncbi:hypothetical protein [Methylorubrum sp. SB2]|uniref:hypothetical protein n=1 Tax=Methylorubrum subtropicum TaxID=3138812 RepID=UPI00313EC08D
MKRMSSFDGRIGRVTRGKPVALRAGYASFNGDHPDRAEASVSRGAAAGSSFPIDIGPAAGPSGNPMVPLRTRPRAGPADVARPGSLDGPDDAADLLREGLRLNAGYVSALAALAGSAIGALASFATTWMTQRFQDRAQRLAQTSARRERLYGEFIDEASRLFGDALTHGPEDPSKLVGLYAIRSKLLLFASPSIIDEANKVMVGVVEAHRTDPATLDRIGRDAPGRPDVLRGSLPQRAFRGSRPRSPVAAQASRRGSHTRAFGAVLVRYEG